MAGECGPARGSRLSRGQLAAQFDKLLDYGHQTIKLWVCFSGEGVTFKKGLSYSFWQRTGIAPSGKIISPRPLPRMSKGGQEDVDEE